MKYIFKYWHLIFIAFLIFLSGVTVGLIYQVNKNFQTAGASEGYLIKEQKNASLTNSQTPQPHNQYAVLLPPASGNTTITETEPITADKNNAPIGETINFRALIKNQGTKNKSLAYVCLNRSGATAFNCVANRNLSSDEDLVVSGSTMFVRPGDYSVWVTVSEDGTNFYRPLNAGTAFIKVE